MTLYRAAAWLTASLIPAAGAISGGLESNLARGTQVATAGEQGLLAMADPEP